MLNVKDICVFYRKIQVIWSLCLIVHEDELVSIVGSNGAGKTTVLKTISGLLKCSSGSIFFEGERIDTLRAHEVSQRGLILIPEGRRLFPYMSVLENLELGSYSKRSRDSKEHSLSRVFDILPVLREKKDVFCSSLSGGEQQMVAIGRGLMANPKLLMMDEPSLGLSPLMIKLLFDIIKKIKEEGVTLLLVEQNVRLSIRSSSRGYVIDNGKIIMQGNSEELLESENLRRAYLGGA